MDRFTKCLSFQVLNMMLKTFLVHVDPDTDFNHRPWQVEIILLSAFMTSITAAMLILFTSPLGRDRGSW